MREKLKGAAAIAGVLFFGVYSTWFDYVKAAEIEAEVPMPVAITGYCIHGVTADGTATRKGICAYRPCDIGKTAIVYDEKKRLIGIFEIRDTGSKNIREGRTLDIWCETEEECYELTQHGFIQIVDAEG